ncbi:MAG TPA: TIGR04283 family arsenosugar biosynthesis glycosyltransferase [Burkholderiales bacterium]|nr:TIGR04283 family arsenosugar biosynthesis glycosyltransferase [Burkholderiales bacterium]
MSGRISVVVPTLNEAQGILACLDALAPLRARGHELIVVDGGSDDGTPELARPRADRVLAAPCGRARQMNAGARDAAGDALVFLHADVRLPQGADGMVLEALAARPWGRFDVRLDSSRALLGLVGGMMNLRSRLTGIATGDQALFVRRELFERLGGYAEIPLMEDVELSSRLRRAGRPACLRARVLASARRWEARGALRTVVLMWRLRLAYFLGADPARLAERYR